MSHTAAALAQKVWSYAHVLRDDGLGFMEYTEQITYLLFLKLASEQRGTSDSGDIAKRYNWHALRSIRDDRALERRYQLALKNLSKKAGLLGVIFAKPQSKINDPAKLRHLIDMIEEEDWSSLDVDVKGEVYESLLARNSEDVRGGAGQYFTPRPVIRAIVEVMRPRARTVICDPAVGTGGFLLAAYEWLRSHSTGYADEQFLRTRALRGSDIVTNVARLCMMNLYLHDIGTDPEHPPITIGDSLASRPKTKVAMVLTNPPFGKKSLVKRRQAGQGGGSRDDRVYARNDFWATTSNKQLNFVQHVYSMLKDGGRAAMVVPDNVLFEGGAGEKVRRALLTQADVHTLLRLPTGIWYSTGVTANVLFFDKMRPRNRDLWIYDLRTNKNFTLRENPITSDDLRDFVNCYQSESRSKRKESERFRRYTHAEILHGPKASLDLSWLSDDSFKDPINMPSHKILAEEVVLLLKQALCDFEMAMANANDSAKPKRRALRRR
ncbi:MAG TPA: class I SAM-dependent DNA methyltransferase [Chthoniobacterales bacterium]|nr:class I SAM-dependent DNA methyltransferase [Chthoniobacterales bacterium]